MPSHEADFNIVLAGEAGQGIQVVEAILVEAARRRGYHVFATKEYMSRVRGGANSTTVRIAPTPVRANAARIDLLVALSADSPRHLEAEGRLGAGTLVIADEGAAGGGGEVTLPLSRWAKEAGDELYKSAVAAGIVCGILGLDEAMLGDIVGRQFAAKGQEAAEGNRRAAAKGYEGGRGLATKVAGRIPPPAVDAGQGGIVLDGAEAVALGSLAGGCTFVCAYPMTPGSSVLNLMAGYSRRLDIVVEQAEDEIAAVNMALGAWYAGARALVTTSGGGFALMGEGLSLAGAAELPLVIHLAQRPGPATGMPTRTEQGDLELALYAGHGNFPRALLAPGSLEEGFRLARHAMGLADACQMPVILLTDQYFVDSYHDVADLPLEEEGAAPRTSAPDLPYRRYALTEDGISARVLPGHGAELAVADSHEHDEEGFITEEASVRDAMVAKRLRKLETARSLALPATRTGPDGARTLVLSWGSTGPIVAEALETLALQDVAGLHFSQPYPLHAASAKAVLEAKDIIVVEANETGQFADLLGRETGRPVTTRILKSDGRPFSVEEVARRLGEAIRGGPHAA